jgi:hypothetical protein
MVLADPARLSIDHHVDLSRNKAMTLKVWEMEINSETSEEDLQRCVLEANRTGDTNVLRAAAKASAELVRREREEWRERFNAESRERVNAQRFQQTQMDKQIGVADRQVKAARSAMWAAWAAAIATIAIALIAAITLVGATA